MAGTYRVAPTFQRADEVGAEALAGAAHPAYLPGRDSDDEREGRDVAGHHRPGADEGMGADAMPTHDRRVGPDAGAASDPRRPELRPAVHERRMGR